MTTIAEALAAAAAGARRIKEGRSRKADSMLPAALLAYRGDALVAQVFPTGRAGTPDLLHCARVAARGFAPDVLALVHDTYMTAGPVNPVTGQPWQRGEPTEVAERHGGITRGWVTDAIMVVAYNRAGDSGARTLPYRIVTKDVVWLPEPEPAGAQIGGPVHETMLKLMVQEPTFPQFLALGGLSGADFGMDPEEACAQADLATVHAFTEPGRPRATVCLAAAPGTRRAAIIARALPAGKIVRP